MEGANIQIAGLEWKIEVTRFRINYNYGNLIFSSHWPIIILLRPAELKPSLIIFHSKPLSIFCESQLLANETFLFKYRSLESRISSYAVGGILNKPMDVFHYKNKTHAFYFFLYQMINHQLRYLIMIRKY